jgi:ABC-type amino acid transport substrate-binding protein
MNPLRHAAALLILATLFSGCGAHDKDRTSAVPANADTLQREVIHKISMRVIGGISASGKLSEIKKRGVLRIALPPAEPPFQSVDPNLGIPIGFNPALAYEIATILEVKPNIVILDSNPRRREANIALEKSFDLLFLPERSDACAPGGSLPYFYSGPGAGWKTICSAETDGPLTIALKEILTYLNETGIYAQLYGTYVSK